MDNPKGRTYRRVLSDKEEEAIMQLGLRCSEKRVPLNRRNLADDIPTVLSRLPSERMIKIPFR